MWYPQLTVNEIQKQYVDLIINMKELIMYCITPRQQEEYTDMATTIQDDDV